MLPSEVQAANPTQVHVVSQPGMSKPLTDEERKHLLDNLRNNMGQSILKVEGPKDMYAYWACRPIGAEDQQAWSRLEALGFRVVLDSLTNPRYKANGIREDGIAPHSNQSGRDAAFTGHEVVDEHADADADRRHLHSTWKA